MDKVKIFELKIEEDDEISGVDQISLVDEPAIEVNWIAFNKEKAHEFHIPDGEDSKYIEMLEAKAENEQDLLDQGYVVDSIEILDGKNSFATNPNAASDWDDEQYQIRYKYFLNPRITGQAAVIDTTRDFCKTLINKNYVWRVEEMEALQNDQGSSALVWRGGYNCRHIWGKIRYKKDATIVNKASINKGKADVGGFPSGLAPELDILGYPQPDTVTQKTLGNPSPSTIRNLGLSKEKFARMKVSIDFDDTLETQRGQDLARYIMNNGYDLYVVTRRQQSQSSDVYAITKKLNIPNDKVIFTNGRLKWETLKRLGIQKHIDNNPEEIKAIKENAPLIQAVQFEIDDQNVNVFGYHTKYFALCPSAQELFRHLVTMEVDEDAQGMIRSAARAADNVFEIEIEVVRSEKATEHQYEEALISVDDMDDIMVEVDKIVGMEHDISFMDNHLDVIAEYLKEDLGYDVSTIVGYKDPGIYPKKKRKRRSYAEVGPRGGIRESDKAPKSDTPNPEPKGEGTAKGDASGKRGAEVTAEQEKTLQNKVDEFNEKESNTKNGRATLGALKSVFQRGLGAFNTSHSPRVQSAEQWAYARVNAFLYLLKNGRPENPKYDTDYDLLPKGHPKAQMSTQRFESYSDYPDSVKNNAKAVLKWAEENGWGSCGTDVGKQRANQLANGEPISEDTIQRMYSYLSRHAVDLESSKSYGDGCGKLMYDAWGGKSALSWAESKINAINKEKMSKQEFKTDDEKRIVLGPAMIPELKIYRKDKQGNPYYVYFSEDTIKMIADKYMRNKYLDNNDEMHNGKAVKDVYVYESWIKEDMQDKSNKYGYGDLPIGTWFVAMKVRNDETWNKIKAGELKGFSVSGYFEEIAQFAREEMFLNQLAELLKKID